LPRNLLLVVNTLDVMITTNKEKLHKIKRIKAAKKFLKN